jgi:hypothetical protein
MTKYNVTIYRVTKQWFAAYVIRKSKTQHAKLTGGAK